MPVGASLFKQYNYNHDQSNNEITAAQLILHAWTCFPDNCFRTDLWHRFSLNKTIQLTLKEQNTNQTLIDVVLFHELNCNLVPQLNIRSKPGSQIKPH